MRECQYQKILDSLNENDATKLEEILAEINISQWNSLHFAAAYEKLDLARGILAKSKAGLNAPDKLNRTPLTIASSKGNLPIVKLLCENGAEIGHALHHACNKKRTNCISFLLRQNCDVNLKDAKSYTPLILACAKGDLDTARALIEHGAEVNCADYQGSTALHWACESPSVELVQFLISQGANVDAEDSYKFTPLLCALIRNEDWPEIVTVLLNNGAKYKDDVITAASNAKSALELLRFGCDVNGVDAYDNAGALFNAAFQNQIELAAVLLEHQARPDLASKGGWTALHVASHFGHAQFVELLLRHNAAVNAASAYNVLPIHLAASQGHLDVAKQLLRAGSLVSVASLNVGVVSVPCFAETDVIEGHTPLYLATSKKHPDIAKLLIEHGAKIEELGENYEKLSNGFTELHHAALLGNDVDLTSKLLDSVDFFNRTPLSIAAAKGHVNLVKKLAPLVDLTKGLPLHYAIENGSMECIRALSEYPQLINSEDSSKRTPLLLATGKNNLDAVQMLLDKGADPNHANEWNETALHLCKQAKLCSALITHGAEVNVSTCYQDTPLWCSNGDPEVMRILLEHGADVNARDKILWTCLHAACHEAHSDCVQVLLKHNADLYAVNDENETPLYLSTDHTDVLTTLLAKCATKQALVNACADGGWSPLHMAVRDGNLKSVRCLIDNGADVNSANADNVFPIYLAAFYGHVDILKALIEAGSCLNVPVNEVGFINPIANSSKNLKCVKFGFTPLMAAVFAGKLDAVEALVAGGAALDMNDLEGNSVLKLAQERGYSDIAEFLIGHGATKDKL